MKWYLYTPIFLLAGCSPADVDDASGNGQKNGRYVGLGIYSAGALWRHIKGIDPAKDPATARLKDDEHIIVSVDTQTGEVRQCGAHSGFCTTLNPWKTAILPGQHLPVRLDTHSDDLANDGDAPTPAKKR
jgi:hypothetical protein